MGRHSSPVAAPTQRFMALTDFETKADATVKFAVGSSKLSAEAEEELKKLAETPKGLKGYTSSR
jgi:outer membrane protein OmpA-like peptidoglycan-associated protein